MMEDVKIIYGFSERSRLLMGGESGNEEKTACIYSVIDRELLKALRQYFILLSNGSDPFVDWNGRFPVRGNDRFPFSRLIADDYEAYTIFASIFNSVIERYAEVLPQAGQSELEDIFLVFTEVLHVVGAYFMNEISEHDAKNLFEKLAYYDESLNLPTGLSLRQAVKKANPQTTVLIGFKLHKKKNNLYDENIMRRMWRDGLPHAVRDWVISNSPPRDNLYVVGDNYFILMLTKTDLTGGRKMAEQLRLRFDEPWQVDGCGGSCKVKCGCNVSIVPLAAAANYKDMLISLMAYTVDYAAKHGGIVEADDGLLEELLYM